MFLSQLISVVWLHEQLSASFHGSHPQPLHVLPLHFFFKVLCFLSLVSFALELTLPKMAPACLSTRYFSNNSSTLSPNMNSFSSTFSKHFSTLKWPFSGPPVQTYILLSCQWLNYVTNICLPVSSSSVNFLKIVAMLFLNGVGTLLLADYIVCNNNKKIVRLRCPKLYS